MKIFFYLIIFFLNFSLKGMDESISSVDNFRKKLLAAKNQETHEKNETEFRSYIPQYTFRDMVGMIPDEVNDIVQEIQTSIANNKHVKTYKVILYGPPGGGKTSLAKAIAGQLGWYFYNVLAGDLISKYQGSGNENITLLLNTIRKSGQRSVLFIDEIDGLVNEDHANSSSELRRAIQALHKIDDIEENLVCIIATNEQEKIAKTLKSRFAGEQISIGLPDTTKRLLMLQHLLRDYDSGAVNLKNIALLTHNFDLREMQALVKKIIRISVHTSGPDVRILPADAFFLALYMLQKNRPLSIDQVKKLFFYWIKRLMPEINIILISELLNNQTIQSSLIDLSPEEIKQSILSLKNLKSSSTTDMISVEDIFVSIYYNNEKKLPNNFQIQRILRYFLDIQTDALNDISQDLAGNCTGEELHSMIETARNMHLESNTYDICYYLMLQILMLLERRAKPHTIVEGINISKQYNQIASLNGGLNMGGRLGTKAGAEGGINAGIAAQGKTEAKAETSGGINIGGTLNLPYLYEKHFKHFIIEKTLLKHESDYIPTQSVGDEVEKKSRLEFCNIKTPSISLIRFIIQYYLTLNDIDVEISMNNIMNYPHFLKILIISQVSCTTIKNIIQLTCRNAIQNQSRICNANHLIDAFYELGFNILWYNVSCITDSQVSRTYPQAGTQNNDSKCTIS